MWAELTDGGLPVKRVITSPGPITDANGTQHPRDIFRLWSREELAAVGWAPFRELSYDSENFRSTGVTDAVVGGEVVRTHTVVPVAIERLKARRIAEVELKRSAVAHGGITFNTKPFATDRVTVESVNLIASALLDGETLPAGFIWTAMTGERVPVTEANFKAFRNAVARHFVLATEAASGHITAIEVLAGSQAVIDYDSSAGWPENPQA